MKAGAYMGRPRNPLSKQRDFAWTGKTPRPSTSPAQRIRFQCDRCFSRWRSTVKTPSPCCSATVTALGMAGQETTDGRR